MQVKTFLYIFSFALLLSCGGEKTKIKCEDCAITISASDSIIFTSVDTSNIYDETTGIMTPTPIMGNLGNSLPTDDATDTTITSSASEKSSNDIAGSVATSSTASIVDTQNLSEAITISHNFPDLGQTCSVNVPGVEISCSSTSYTLEDAFVDFYDLEEFYITMSVTNFSGQTGSISSNIIDIDHFYIQQINKDYAFVKIKYLGKISKIINKLKKENINLNVVAGQWQLSII